MKRHFHTLTGLRIFHVEGLEQYSEEVQFFTSGGVFSLGHERDCCESVKLEDIVGDPADLEGAIVASASVDSNTDTPHPEPEKADCFEWHFYNIQTHKGHVQLRWLGESNGYYSMQAVFRKVSNRNTPRGEGE